MRSSDVLVVGGGPSGLAAAFRLRRAGLNVRVLDAADRVGGKMRTTPRDGYLVDQGAFFLPTTHRTLLALADEAGIGEQIVPGGFVLATVRDGVIHELDGLRIARAAFRTRLLSTRAKLEAAKLLPELFRARHAVYERMPDCGAYDTETVADWAQSRFSRELREYALDTTLRGIFATSAATAPRVDFLAILALLRGARLVAFRGGMGAYAEALARDLDLQLHAEVQEVTPTADGVRVRWRDAQQVEHCEAARACIVALPARFTRTVLPGLDRWRQEFLQRVRHGQTFVLNVALQRPPNVAATYIQVPQAAHPFVTGIMLDHHKAPGRAPPGKGLLSVAVLDRWCEQHWQEPDAQVQRQLLDAVDSLLPGTRQNAVFVELHRWHQEYNTVGFYRELGEFRRLCEGDARIQLAGDFHSMQNLEAATITGLRAAQRLLDKGLLR